MERWKNELAPLLPKAVGAVLSELSDADRLLELRLRAGLPMQLVFDGYDRIVYASGGKPMLTEQGCAALLSRLCEDSVYAWETELSGGFLTVRGGYRVGIAGRCAVGADGKLRYTAVNGFCIRIVREVPGAAKAIVPYVTEGNRLLSTLLISPPNCGKTTALRDLIRTASDGLYGVRPMRVCVSDERFELSGACDGSRLFDLGARTDTVSGLNKADSLERMLTALSPEALASDELTVRADQEAIHRAGCSGVTVLATAHAGCLSDLQKREPTAKLLRDRVFSRIVLLGRTPRVGAVQCVWNADGTVLFGEAA